jgi:hypothetical protein
VAVVSKRSVQPPADEISRLFALMMPERAAKPPPAVTAAAVAPQGVPPALVQREVAERVEAQHEGEAQEYAALLAAIAQDRVRQRRREAVFHVALIVVFCAIALPILGVWLAKLLMPLPMAR